MLDGCAAKSADPRELFADLGRDYAVCAHGCAPYEHARMLGGDVADAGSVMTEWVAAQDVENTRSCFGRYEENCFAFIGHVDRVETEEFAG